MQTVLEKYSPVNVSTENNQPKLIHLAKDFFQIDIRNDFDYLNNVKESIRFFSLDLPSEIKEIFIPYSEAPVFWIYESPLLTQIEEFMKLNLGRGAFIELHKSVKENYTKWVTTKLKSEKEYYATTTVNFCERDINRHNFFKNIIKGIIYTYQSTFYNPARALEMYTSAREIINGLRLSDQVKNEIKYILNLYSGFLFIKENNFEKANLEFKDAIDTKNQGGTAKIYCALTEIHLGNTEAAEYLLKEVFNSDINRLALAIKTSNPGMFSYFFRNAFIYNVFHEKIFGTASSVIEQVLTGFRTDDYSDIGCYKEKLEILKSKKVNEYYDDEINKSIAFLEKYSQSYNKSANILLLYLLPEIRSKYDSIINSILNRVKEKYYSEVREKISNYDAPIMDNVSAEKHLVEELEKFKVKSKERLAESLQQISENYENENYALENKLNEIQNIDRLNPGSSFANNMIYNIIIAFVVFFIGGVAGYSNKHVTDGSEVNSIFSFILMAGSKWGAISFVVGALISLVISGTIMMERSDIRQKLIRKMNYLKIEKEKSIIETKESFAQNDKMMVDSFNNSINQHHQRVEELKAQKETTEKELMVEANQKVQVVADQLNSIPQ